MDGEAKDQRGKGGVVMEVRWVGLDGGESAHRLCLLTAGGEKSRSFAVRNCREDLREELMRLREAVSGEQVRVVVESHRGFCYLVVQLAMELGLEVWEVATTALERYRETEGPPRKDDARDAYLLGRMGYLRLPSCRPVLEGGEAERQLCRRGRARERIVRRHSQGLQRLRSLLLELAPELVQKGSGAPGWSSRRLRVILERWPGLQGLERSRVSTVVGLLRGVGEEQKQREAKALRAIAGSIGMPAAEREVVRWEMDLLLAELRLQEEALRQVEEELEAGVREHPVGRKLLEMPGVGVIHAATELGESLALARRASEGQVATYGGTTPLSRHSGKSQRSRLARGTNKHLLHARYLSALAAIRVSPLDRAYYEKKRADYQGHPAAHTKALLALARQRSKVLYKLMTTEARYEEKVLLASYLERRKAA